jgi:GT2 family glycosyltransferase
MRKWNIPILIVEQLGDAPFNRGMLLNIGAKESKADYYIFHDVDMIPVNADYSYPEVPTHIATKVSQFGYKMPYPEYFGGVTLFNKDDFKKVNGFPNTFWGWGAEDDELYRRTKAKGFTIARRLCRFNSLYHKRNTTNQNAPLLELPINWKDGLNSLKYTIEKTENIRPNVTKIMVHLPYVSRKDII